MLSNCHSIGSPIVINWIKFISGVAPRSFPFIKGNDRGAVFEMKLDWESIGIRLDVDWYLIGNQLLLDWILIAIKLSFNW